MIVWNITCECGHDHDYDTLGQARKEAIKHLNHNKDKSVYIDQVKPDMDEQGNYQTGKYVIVR